MRATRCSPSSPRPSSKRSTAGSRACPRREDIQMSALIRVLCFIGLVSWPGVLAAQEFPTRTIRFVVPFPAGGPSDTISRILIEKMSSLLGQPMVIENRAGAGGMIGIASVAKSDPNGYTIAIAPSSQLSMNVNLRDDRSEEHTSE